MLLRLQRYNLKVLYHKGTEMYLADVLNRVYMPVNDCDTRPSVENTDATMFLHVTDERLQQVRHATSDDLVLFLLNEVIRAWREEVCATRCAAIQGSS